MEHCICFAPSSLKHGFHKSTGYYEPFVRTITIANFFTLTNKITRLVNHEKFLIMNMFLVLGATLLYPILFYIQPQTLAVRFIFHKLRRLSKIFYSYSVVSKLALVPQIPGISKNQ